MSLGVVVFVSVYESVGLGECLWVCMFVCWCVWAYLCVSAFVCADIHVYTPTHPLTHTIHKNIKKCATTGFYNSNKKGLRMFSF